MNFGEEPIIAAVVNVIVSLLVSKGIIDSTHAPMLSQEINNVLAALVTLGLGGYSIYKTVEAYKHKVSSNQPVQPVTPSTPQAVVTEKNTTIPPTSETLTVQQTGLPTSPVTA